jgi:hypothetical protein
VVCPDETIGIDRANTKCNLWLDFGDGVLRAAYGAIYQYCYHCPPELSDHYGWCVDETVTEVQTPNPCGQGRPAKDNPEQIVDCVSDVVAVVGQPRDQAPCGFQVVQVVLLGATMETLGDCRYVHTHTIDNIVTQQGPPKWGQVNACIDDGTGPICRLVCNW